MRARRAAPRLADLVAEIDSLDTTVPTVRKRRARLAGSERQIQIAIIDRLRFKGVLVVHVPNGGNLAGGALAGHRMQQEGLRPGFPDLLAYGPPSDPGRHACMEVKRPGWTASDVSGAQRECHAELRRRGIPVAIVDSQDAAVAFLASLGWPV